MYRSEKKIKTLICIITALIFIFFSFMLNGVWADENDISESYENDGSDDITSVSNTKENNELNGQDDNNENTMSETTENNQIENIVTDSENANASYDQYGEEYIEKSTTVCRVYGPYNINVEGVDVEVPYKYYDSLEEAVSQSNGESVIEIIVEEVEINSTIIPPRSSKITTSSDLLDSGKTATIKRGSNCTGTMINNTMGVTIENIIIDGGWNDNHNGVKSTGAVINSSSTLDLSNVTIKNNFNTSSDGGGAIVSTGVINANSGTVIQNCGSTYAGAIKSTSNIFANDLTINKCYSTNDEEDNASAIHSSGGLYATGLKVTNCAAVNATIGGAAIWVKGGAEFKSSESSNVEISNNYSAGSYSGFYPYTINNTWTIVDIYTDVTINGNKAGCTFDDNWNLVSIGRNSNLNVTDSSKINIKTTVTSKSSVGVTVLNATSSSKRTIIANYENGCEGVELGYFSDADNSPAFETTNTYGGRAVAISANFVQLDKPVIKIMQKELSNLYHTYRIDYMYDGVSKQMSDSDGTQIGTTTLDDCIYIAVDPGSTVKITMDNTWNENLQGSTVTLEATDLAEGVENPENVGWNPDIPYTVTIKLGENVGADTISVITYIFNEEEVPDTGFKENVFIIVFFIVIVSVYGIILIKMKE